MKNMPEQTSFSSFTGYKQMVMELTANLRKLREYSQTLDLKGNVDSIDSVIKRLEEDSFSVAIIGEFNRGKSTLINALLGKPILPMDVLPTTATLNKITYSITPFVKITYKDGRTEEVEVEKLSEYVTKLTKDGEKKAREIKEATVYYPINYCKNGVTIIDTPGLNDDAAMSEVTMSVLPQIDAALMVIMAQSPFSESERDFLESKVITSDLGRILFVVTGIDLLDEEDVERVLNNITARIEEHVMAKAAKTMGADSKEFQAYKQKIGKVRVYGLSAKMALKAKASGNQEKLEQSCFPAFENALERFLTEDRGAVMLSVPVNKIRTASVEIFKTVGLRESALKMRKEEFDEKYSQAMDEIETIREQRRVEFNRINTSAQYTYDELRPKIKNFWPELEAAAMNVIDSFPLQPADIDDNNAEATQAAINNAIKKEVTASAQSLTEQIQSSIAMALENEAERLSGFENNFYEATEKIQNLFSVSVNSGASKSDTIFGAAIGGLIGYGVGGAYLGFKEAGWKGALLGGATGLAGTLGMGLGINLLIGALALPVTWPVAIIAAAAAGIAGTFTGKFAIGKIFGGQRIEKFKASYKETVSRQFAEMQAQDDFAEKVRTQVEGAFEALKTKIKTETENILSDTQNTLTQLKVSLAENQLSAEKEQAELKQMIDNVNEIAAQAEDVNKQLISVLNR
jgi:GTPase